MAAPEHLQGITNEKSRLQEYAQRAGGQLPVYQTLQEGPPHACQFKSQVLVDGIWYPSPNAFSSRKVAEHDAAKHAFIGFREKLKAEGRTLVLEELHFGKAIINEYAVKMNMNTPTYVTNQSKAYVPIFVSALQLNGVTFTGEAARTKKEAEQFAARSAILSILASEAGTTMSVILKSKFKFHNALKRVKDSSSIQAFPVMNSSSTQASPVMNSSSIKASPVMDSSSIKASPVMDSSSTQTSPVMVSSSTQTSPVMVSSSTQASTVIVSSSTQASPLMELSNIPARVVSKDPSITPACIAKDGSITPACIAKDGSITPACIVKPSSSISACVQNPVSMQACIVQDSPNIQLGPVAAEVAPLNSALASFTSVKEVDFGLCAIKDTLASIRQPSFAPFPSLELAHSESFLEQPSRSQLTHQSLHVFKKPKPNSSVEAVTPPIVFVPPTVEQASVRPPVCSASAKQRRRNKKSGKNLLYMSPPTVVMVPQNQVPAFPVTTQQSSHSVSLQGFVA